MCTNSCSNKEYNLSVYNFVPFGEWTPDEEGEKFYFSERPMWIKDSMSGDKYLNQPTNVLRYKLSFLTGVLASFLGNPVSLGINAAYRATKVFTLSHFWLPIEAVCYNKNDESYHFGARLLACIKDIIRIVATPFALIGLLVVSWVGAIDPRENGPRDGAKIYSAIEIAMYGGTADQRCFCWAPCYQPSAVKHGLGGDIRDENAH